MVRVRKSWMWAGVVMLVIAGWAYYYRHSHVITVETVAVKQGDLTVSVTPTETGTVDSDATAQVKAEVAGRVSELAVAEGAKVKAGEVLIKLEAGELQARVALARSSLDAARSRLESARISLPLERARTGAALAEAQARYDDAKQKYDKKRKLFDARLVPQGEMESAGADLATAEAVLETARANREQVTLQQRQIELAAADVKQQEAALRVAEVTFDHSVIRSPLAGTVVELPVKLGELLQPGSAAARVTCLDALYVKAQIDEVDLSQLRVGQRADIQFDTEPNTKYSAELFEISPAVSVEKLKSRNVTIKLRLAAPPPFLRPGMSADAEIIVDTLKNVLLVPAQTVMTKDKERFVYMLADGEVVKRTVDIGRSNWDYIEIRNGLHTGDTVISSLDVEGIKPGVRARLADKKSRQ